MKPNLAFDFSFDPTIDGWFRALELLYHETTVHSKQVANITLRLARALNVRQSDLTYIYRGALLHDIGKLGIPDTILLKPGNLNEEERRIVQQHPTIAYEMLAPIPYLHKARDIPYCHHEQWNGIGYPRGLKGEEIPFSARIFAVADVWDALISNRPYRKAWPAETALAYLREQAGEHRGKGYLYMGKLRKRSS